MHIYDFRQLEWNKKVSATQSRVLGLRIKTVKLPQVEVSLIFKLILSPDAAELPMKVMSFNSKYFDTGFKFHRYQVDI